MIKLKTTKLNVGIKNFSVPTMNINVNANSQNSDNKQPEIVI